MGHFCDEFFKQLQTLWVEIKIDQETDKTYAPVESGFAAEASAAFAGWTWAVDFKNSSSDFKAD